MACRQSGGGVEALDGMDFRLIVPAQNIEAAAHDRRRKGNYRNESQAIDYPVNETIDAQGLA